MTRKALFSFLRVIPAGLLGLSERVTAAPIHEGQREELGWVLFSKNLTLSSAQRDFRSQKKAITKQRRSKFLLAERSKGNKKIKYSLLNRISHHLISLVNIS